MHVRLLLATLVFCFASAAAQTNKTYPVNAGEIPGKVLPREAIYLLPNFTPGTVSFKDGTSSTQLFNYYLLLDEMHFINGPGDTLAIADSALIKSVVIDSLVFYYDKGYLMQIFTAGPYKLESKQQMVQMAYKTTGGYDAASAGGSIKTYGSINKYGQVYQLQVKKDVLFEQKISFYMSKGFGPFLKANKKNFHMLFPEKDVTAFIKKHRTDFNKEQDLEALLQFCVE